MNVEKFRDHVQKLEFQGSTPIPNSVTRTDNAGLAFNKEGLFSINSAGVDSRQMFTQTTQVMKTNTIHPVHLDLSNGTSKVVTMPNKYKDPKGMFGTNE